MVKMKNSVPEIHAMPLLVDTSNLYYCARKAHDESRIDYQKYVQLIEDLFGPQQRMIAYVSRPDESAQKFIAYLETLGMEVVSKEPRPIRVGSEEAMWANFNVELAVNAMALANPNEPLIIGSNDPHLLPLLKELVFLTGVLFVYCVGPPKAFQQYAKTREIEGKILRKKDEFKQQSFKSYDDATA